MYVGSPSRISPGGAASSKRLATLTASPVAKRCPPPASPATTSPVLTPVRTAIVTPQSRASSSLSAERRSRISDRSPNRPQRVVLVDDRNPENGHHGVTDELLDDSLVALDDGLHLVEVAAHHASQRLRVELLAERSRSRDVRKDDRHGLSHLAGGLFGHERGPARAAEREALWVLLTAAGARNHAAESSFRRMMSQ